MLIKEIHLEKIKQFSIDVHKPDLYDTHATYYGYYSDDVLIAINEYHNKCYIIHYAFNEVNFIYEGERMSEGYNNL